MMNPTLSHTERAQLLGISPETLSDLIANTERPGRLEGESLRTAYFDLRASEGTADETQEIDGYTTDFFRASPGEIAALDLDAPIVAVWIDGNGFVFSEEIDEIPEPEPEGEI